MKGRVEEIERLLVANGGRVTTVNLSAVRAALSLPLSRERVRGDADDGQTRKYGNRKVELDGRLFHSKREARGYLELKMRVTAGDIEGFACQPVFPLLGLDGSEVYTYTADFFYIYRGIRVCEDYKSKATHEKDTWRVVRKLFRSTYGYDITER